MKRLIDFSLSKTFLVISVPAAITGALLSHMVDDSWIRFAYGALVIILAFILLRGHEVPVRGDV